MRTKKTLFYSIVVLAASALLMFVKADFSWAESMTLKVSHQFAAGDVRDQMGRVFGEMVTKRTKGTGQARSQVLYRRPGPGGTFFMEGTLCLLNQSTAVCLNHYWNHGISVWRLGNA